MIETRELTKRYPRADNPQQTFNAVDGLSLAIDTGEIYGILGPNGAGKTTTLEMIEGLTDIDAGDAFVDGIDVQAKPYAIKQIIGVQLQANEYFDRLSLTELLDFFCALYSRRADPLELLERVQLGDKARAKPANLSGGQQQRFSIACALANQPKILFLDEPTTGLDPQARHNLWDLVRDLNGKGITVVLTTHNMDEAEELCQRIAIMDHGRIVAEDTPQNLILEHAPEPPQAALHGNIEDVFLAVTGHALRD
ncbi:MAG: ABC transporter ATP-binding protein [Acidobacteriota bacterium]|nr:ABC transporter ATP-binding protein [Acidobacteriota bacterium]